MALNKDDIKGLEDLLEQAEKFKGEVFDWVSPLGAHEFYFQLNKFREKITNEIGFLKSSAVYFAVCELPSADLKNKGIFSGEIITDGFNKHSVIQAALMHLITTSEENEEWGEHERELVLFTQDENEDEIYEIIKLEWVAEKDEYDGGRYDYYSSRGCTHA